MSLNDLSSSWRHWDKRIEASVILSRLSLYCSMLCLIIFSVSSSNTRLCVSAEGAVLAIKLLEFGLLESKLELEIAVLLLPALTASSYPSLILFKDLITSKVNFLSLLSKIEGFLKLS